MHGFPSPQPLSQRERGSTQGDFPLPMGEDARRAGAGERREAKLTSKRIRCYARELRKSMTQSERNLWHFLRKRRLNALKFRRQHPVGHYILDFYCHELKLAIEIDGNQHAEDNQRAYDMQRSEVLANLGITVLRFRNCSVLNEHEKVLSDIVAFTSKYLPSPQPLSQRERG